MLDQVLDFFDIRPDFDLNIMSQAQDLIDVTCRVLEGCRKVFDHFKPDLVLVQGDTTTCFSGALAAYYHRVPVGHIEAGLRTGDLNSPYPEEGNRRLVSKLATLHFAPTALNVQNLINEGINPDQIWNTGNTVIDALLHASLTLNGFSTEATQNRLGTIFSNSQVILVTGHRRENFGRGFKEICLAIKDLAVKYPAVSIVYPVHLNPNVQKPVYELLSGLDNIILTEPLSYQDFIYAMKNSYIILTDSGGVQEEGPSFGKPILVMRETTERPEAVQAGVAKLVGPQTNEIVNGVSQLMESKVVYEILIGQRLW